MSRRENPKLGEMLRSWVVMIGKMSVRLKKHTWMSEMQQIYQHHMNAGQRSAPRQVYGEEPELQGK